MSVHRFGGSDGAGFLGLGLNGGGAIRIAGRPDLELCRNPIVLDMVYFCVGRREQVLAAPGEDSLHGGWELSWQEGRLREGKRCSSFSFPLSSRKTQNVPACIVLICATDHCSWLFLADSLLCTCILLVAALQCLRRAK